MDCVFHNNILPLPNYLNPEQPNTHLEQKSENKNIAFSFTSKSKVPAVDFLPLSVVNWQF